MPDLSRLLAIVRTRPVLVTAIASAATLLLAGVVLLTTTELGCSTGRSLKLKPAGGCVAIAGHPTSTIGQSLPVPPVATGGVPYVPPASAGSGPYVGPASGSTPAYIFPGSGSQSPYHGPNGPASGATPAQYAVSCRLPVFAGQSGSGGFISFPDGTFIADPRSEVSVSPAPQVNGPGYQGNFGLWWDRTYSRWLPVGYAWVSPDESRYAYPATDGVYVKNVASGALSELGQGHQWSVIDVEATGVYAEYQGSSGLWFLPFSGSPRQVTSHGYWQAATASAAFGTATSAVPSGASTTIIKLDFNTGTTTDWFTRPGAQSSVAGFDRSGNPIIYVNGPGGNETWVVPSADAGTLIAAASYGPYGGSGFGPNGTPIADAHGIWFAGNGGIALYVSGSGLYWMANIGGQLAGGCH